MNPWLHTNKTNTTLLGLSFFQKAQMPHQILVFKRYITNLFDVAKIVPKFTVHSSNLNIQSSRETYNPTQAFGKNKE